MNWHTVVSRRSDAARPNVRSEPVYGVDGCPTGWFGFGLTRSDKRRFATTESMKELVNDVGDSARIFIDIPIELQDIPGSAPATRRRAAAELRQAVEWQEMRPGSRFD